MQHFWADNCIKIHARQFECYCPQFYSSLKFAMETTGTQFKFITGEDKGLFDYTSGSLTIVLPMSFSGSAEDGSKIFNFIQPSGLPSFEEYFNSNTGKINFDGLLNRTASETHEPILNQSLAMIVT